jgi:hypothetical protein
LDHVGYVLASNIEDWALALEICERSSANEKNAKEAVAALKKEFKYGNPAGQLYAARVCIDSFCLSSTLTRKLASSFGQSCCSTALKSLFYSAIAGSSWRQ